MVGGYDSDGSPIYVGRSFHEGDCLPTKVIPSKRSAFVAWAGGEHPKAHYELLLGDGYSWQPCFGPNIPPNAISTGKTSSGEAVYVGRGHYANSLTVGKVLPSHGCLYIPYQGGEIKLEKYEVLVYGGGAPEPAPLIDLEGKFWNIWCRIFILLNVLISFARLQMGPLFGLFQPTTQCCGGWQ